MPLRPENAKHLPSAIACAASAVRMTSRGKHPDFDWLHEDLERIRQILMDVWEQEHPGVAYPFRSL